MLSSYSAMFENYLEIADIFNESAASNIGTK